MSADNWRVCPKCLKNDLLDAEAEKKQAKEAYGKVNEVEYLAIKNRAENRSKITAENLREDYGIGMGTDGSFVVEYRCSCDVCGFTFNYEYEKKVKL